MKQAGYGSMAVAAAGLIMAAGVVEGAEAGQDAPEFTLKDQNGASHSLVDFAGKTVVLEWTNYDCPFVKKHYDSGNMQKLQSTYTGKGVVWLSICSSAPGKQGHYDAGTWKKMMADKGSKATAVLLDADGKVGRAYGAKTTPHMFVLNADGKVAYMGAIDSDSGWDPKGIAGAENYVVAALDAVLDGKPVATTETKPYGCSVKF